MKIHERFILVIALVTAVYIVWWMNFGLPRPIFEGIFASSEQKEHIIEDVVVVNAGRVAEPISQLKNVARKDDKCHYNLSDFEDIMEIISRGLKFFELHLTELIVDAVVGTRILQGQLQLLLKSFSLPLKIRKQLEELQLAARNVSDQVVRHFVDVMTSNDQTLSGEKRLKQNLHWIEGGSLWEMPAPGAWFEENKLHLHLYRAEDDDSVLFSDSDFSNRCIGAVFEGCAVPEDCFISFLEKRRSEYFITHSVLFLLFSKKKNCFNNKEYMENIRKLNEPENILASFCEKIWLEAHDCEKRGFPLFYRDLFSEQVLVCSMAGFRQFLNYSWYKTIASWQSKGSLGCFELPKTDFSKTFDEIYNIKKEHNRVKRYDNVVLAGSQSCSVHFTAISIAAIGVHLRYCIETCGETLFLE
ncbi:UPF0764 protein C16orf89 like [Pseudolycoriella hygida]|uniref:UPF0764 protein C16orf89 like n=1 Tax=Pseudolycoriella hygida TaxID=35572 RepID=A0A9Q0MNY0_9DIPT|nr:UPF0764 protein C16orf89 like [Pseudolycoriella hygida]